MIQSKFAERFKGLIEEHGTKYAWLARMIRVNQVTISRWANGHSQPRIDELVIIASIFHTSIDYLVGLSNERIIR